MNAPLEHANAADDLRFVSAALRRRRTFGPDEFVIAMLWAFVNLIGLSLYDVSIWAGGIFWFVALPVFGIGTAWWASKQERERGEADRELGRRHALHWTSIPIFLIASNFVVFPRMDVQSAGQVVLLVVGLVYYLGGVHFWRGYQFAGIAVASGLVWLSTLDRFAWTVTGVLTFLALAGSAVFYRWRGVYEG